VVKSLPKINSISKDDAVATNLIDEYERSELVRKLSARFAATAPIGYIEIAVGEAYSAFFLYKGGQESKAYVYTTAKNKILNEIRYQEKFTKLSSINLGPRSSKEDDSTDTEVFEKELLNILTDKQKEVVKLHFIEGYSFKVIAVKLGISTNSVKDRIKNARKALKKRK